jgi:hypothetical protein
VNPVEAQQICQSAEQALRHGSISLHQFPGLLRRVIEERLWERRRVPGHGEVELPSLRELITAKPLLGWGQDPKRIEAVIRDDPETLTLWRRAMKGKPGPKSGDIVTQTHTPKGNSRSAALDRLDREHPSLYARVVAGELSAHAAAIEAGFRKQRTPLDQLRHWWAKATPGERRLFTQEIG